MSFLNPLEVLTLQKNLPACRQVFCSRESGLLYNVKLNCLFELSVQVNVHFVAPGRPKKAICQLEGQNVASTDGRDLIEIEVRFSTVHLYRCPDGRNLGVIWRIAQVNNAVKGLVRIEICNDLFALWVVGHIGISDVGGAETSATRQAGKHKCKHGGGKTDGGRFHRVSPGYEMSLTNLVNYIIIYKFVRPNLQSGFLGEPDWSNIQEYLSFRGAPLQKGILHRNL